MKFLLWLKLVPALLFLWPAPPDGGNLVVEIKGLRNDKGFVLISVFNNESGFPASADKAVLKEKATVINGRCMLSIKSLAAGIYAIAILHDENKNLKMDYKLIMLPKEGFGFSQDPAIYFGPPKFSKASFKHTGEQHIIINIKYF